MILSGQQPGQVNRLSEGTEPAPGSHTRHRASGSRHQGARSGDFTGPGSAGMSCVWREGLGERSAEPLEESEQGLPTNRGEMGSTSPQPIPGLVDPHESWPLSKSTSCCGKMNQVDQMALGWAHAHPPFTPPLGQHQPFSCRWSKTTGKKETYFVSDLKTSLPTIMFLTGRSEKSKVSIHTG